MPNHSLHWVPSRVLEPFVEGFSRYQLISRITSANEQNLNQMTALFASLPFFDGVEVSRKGTERREKEERTPWISTIGLVFLNQWSNEAGFCFVADSK